MAPLWSVRSDIHLPCSSTGDIALPGAEGIGLKAGRANLLQGGRIQLAQWLCGQEGKEKWGWQLGQTNPLRTCAATAKVNYIVQVIILRRASAILPHILPQHPITFAPWHTSQP